VLSRVSRRLGAELAAKLRLFAGLTVGICVPYFSLQRLVLGAPFVPPASALDAAIPFSPGWVWAYASLFALVPLSALLSRTRADVTAFARALVWLCVPSFAVFALFPSSGPRPAEAHAAGELAWLVAVDTPRNAFPSLHAGLTVLCLLHARRVCGASFPRGARALWDLASLGWGAAIAYGALASKQHWASDLLAGGALGALASWWAARVQRTASA
jgi:membrane-associated phospholipid phosphatase